MRILAALSFALLVANAVPTTVEELTKRADLVVDATVTNLDEGTVVADRAAAPCFDARVTAWLKGSSNYSVKVCAGDISEMTPPTPHLGGHYRMYLQRSPLGIYTAFSYAGFTVLH